MMTSFLVTALMVAAAANVSLVVLVADYVSPKSNSGRAAPTVAGSVNVLAAA